MEEKQTNLFEEIPLALENERTNYLFIIKENKKVEMNIEEIFDFEKFDELYAISYVSSPSFFSKHTRGFKTVKFILGIDDSDNLEKFSKAVQVKKFLDVNDRVDFWNNLDVDTKDSITKSSCEIRYGGTNDVIHDKIYLLRNSKSGENRVIVGSANFTNRAFSKQEQYESIRIDDNNEVLYNLYYERYESIYKNTFDYIPERCKVIHNTDTMLTVTDGEVSKDILLDELGKYTGKIVLNEGQIEEIKDMGIDIKYKKEEVDKTDELLKLISQKRNGKIELKTTSQLKKKSIALKTLYCKTNKKSEETDERPHMIYNTRNNMLLRGSLENQNLENGFCMKIGKEKIKENLEKIEKFIDAYKKFAVNPCEDNQSKVFEMILYAFMSPYIWKIRNDHVIDKGIESVRADFPPFMIVGGVARSGKTTALEFISLLLGNNGKRYFKYGKDVSKSGILFDYFNTSNVYPILVDEIEQSFFHRSAILTKGESFIKYVSNDLTTTHPVMIGTTNLREFSSSSQVLRRIYYLEINNVFDESKKAEAMDYLNEIISEVDNSLFRDFSCRMSESLNNMEQFYEGDDVLYKAREIFNEYYKEANIELPKWFPKKQFRDYESRKVNVWYNLFNAHKEYFKENNKNTIYVYIDDILKNMKSKREKEGIINFLDETCIIENNAILELDKERFYSFIGYKEKKSFKDKLIDRLIKSKG